MEGLALLIVVYAAIIIKSGQFFYHTVYLFGFGSAIMGLISAEALQTNTENTLFLFLRMAACAAGTTSLESETLTCMAWAASKWPKSSGSVGTE